MNGLLFANIGAIAAASAVFLVRRLFMDKIRPKVFVILWMLIIFRLLLPFEFSSGASIYAPIEKPKTETDFSEPIFLLEEEPEYIIQHYHEIEENLSEVLEKPKAEISPHVILLLIYLSGAVFTGGILLKKHRSATVSVLRGCVPFDEVPEIYKDGKTRFYKSKNLASPLSFGILRPVIVIPEETTDEQLPFVLLHEHTHIKDRDAVLKLAALCALSLNWFNPAIWFVVKYFDRDLERYCDERVLSAIGTENASGYANTILDFAERESLSLSCFSAASLSERVISIMKNKNKKGGFFAGGAILFAVVLVMTACGTLPEKKEEIYPDNGEFLELIKNAKWEVIDEMNEFIELEDPRLGEVAITKTAFEGEESLFYSWSFEHLPVRRIIIKDLGFPESNDDFKIFCINDNRSNVINLGDYEYLLERGFRIEYEQGDLILCSEKPLSEPSEELSINIFADPNEIEIVSEVTEIRYLNPEFYRDEELIGYYGDEAPNNYVTSAFRSEDEVEIRSVTVKNFGFSSVNLADIYLYESSDFRVEATWGDQMREAGFSVEISNDGDVIISTAEENYSIAENFDLRIYMDFDSVDFNCSLPVKRIMQGLYPIAENSGTDNSVITLDTDIEFIWPASKDSYLCAGFGSYKGHTGVDIASENENKDIYAAADGKVVKVKFGSTGYGYHVIIDHGNSVHTCYAHCSDIFVKEGQEVKAGDLIASMGSTGNSTGTHLHFEIRINGAYSDPEKYISPTK